MFQIKDLMAFLNNSPQELGFVEMENELISECQGGGPGGLYDFQAADPDELSRTSVLIKNSRFLNNFMQSMRATYAQVSCKNCTFTVTANETVFPVQIQD
jgi:hypothetical protein